jgi:hypothetical protein
MAARSDLNRTRAGVLMSGVPMALIAGLALIGAAASAAWIMRPHFDFRPIEIDVPKLVEKQFDLPKPVDKPFDLPVPVAKPFDLPVPVAKPTAAPKPAPGPVASAAPLPPKTPDKEERKFIDQPDYKSADHKGRIVKSFDNGLHFDNGTSFYPAKIGPDGKLMDNLDKIDESDPFIGDYGYCNEVHDEGAPAGVYYCFVIHNDEVQRVPMRSRTSADPGPPSRTSSENATTPPAMVNTEVDLGGIGRVKALVDTGCSWPLSLPQGIADTLVKKGLAIHAGASKSLLADGTVKDVDVILIKSITVAGRELQDIDAAVAPNDSPVLLGLGALTQLGPFSISDGRIVFDGRPT